jgi:hypothetical protein
MRNRFALSALFVVVAVLPLRAQEGTTFYPNILYPGENVVTIRNARGIETIRVQSTRNSIVRVPEIGGCPTTVNLRVWIEDPTTDESVDFTVYDCQGRFSSTTIHAENWTIRHEDTGPVELGRDTCLRCEVITSGTKIIDSIIVNGRRLSVRMPTPRGPWYSTEADPLNYRICYTPTEIEQVEEKVRLYVRRNQPNGGLTHYMIEKPISMRGVPVPPPPPETKPKRPEPPLMPPLVDPTTFRNIVMPTAETLPKGRIFLGTYDLVGLLAGYGITDDLTVMLGGAYLPEAISRLGVGTIGLKYNALKTGDFLATAGFQYGFSSTEGSDISVAAPYLLLSYGTRSSRLTLGAGYSWKHHTIPTGEFDRNAAVVAIGGDITVKRGWKLAAETYIIESSGLAPLAISSRWFNDHLAFDAGLAIDLSGDTDVSSTGTLSGEITNLRIAPILSLIWVF